MIRLTNAAQTRRRLLLACICALAVSACAAPASPPAVVITDGSRFAPATLTARVGESIVWRNRSPDRHSLVVEAIPSDVERLPTRAGDSELHSGDLFHNEDWSLTFEQPGAYRYICVIHAEAGMVGVLTVADR